MKASFVLDAATHDGEPVTVLPLLVLRDFNPRPFFFPLVVLEVIYPTPRIRSERAPRPPRRG